MLTTPSDLPQMTTRTDPNVGTCGGKKKALHSTGPALAPDTLTMSHPAPVPQLPDRRADTLDAPAPHPPRSTDPIGR